jgi:hypothetical protein
MPDPPGWFQKTALIPAAPVIPSSSLLIPSASPCHPERLPLFVIPSDSSSEASAKEEARDLLP